jgi:hypothetical protein
LLHAAGQDLEAFWNKYPIHYRKDVLSILQPYRIGRLSDADIERAQDSTSVENIGSTPTFLRDGVDQNGKKVEQSQQKQQEAKPKSKSGLLKSKSLARARWRSQCHFAEVALVGLSMPIWEGVRWALRLFGFFLPALTNTIERWLPISIPHYGLRARLPRTNAKTGKPSRVAVVGGGIAGVGAAYTLAKSGYEVIIYEARDRLGTLVVCNSFSAFLVMIFVSCMPQNNDAISTYYLYQGGMPRRPCSRTLGARGKRCRKTCQFSIG